MAMGNSKGIVTKVRNRDNPQLRISVYRKEMILYRN